MPDTTITLYGAAGVSTVTPLFAFSGTVAVWVNETFIKNLTSGTEDSISLAEGQKLEYIASDWDLITTLDIREDKVSGDISGWNLPNSLSIFSISSTSLSGDISGWTLPSGLDIFYVRSTSVSGDISGWTLPNSLSRLYIFSTSLTYESSAGAFTGITNNLDKIDFDNCSLSQSQVDNVLADLVASGITNSSSAKTIDVGDNNTNPSVAGLIHKTILEARGWTTKITAASSFYANGVIDNIIFFSKELSAVDALNIYNQTKWRYGV